MQLVELGWNSFFENYFASFRAEGLLPLRIARENRGMYAAYGEAGEFSCETSGRFTHEAKGRADFPAVGDWVAAAADLRGQKAVIHAVLPRKSAFSRKLAGRVTDEQIVAANIDTAFIVTGLDLNFNLRRIERYLAMAWNSGAMPVVLLNKSDICAEAEIRRIEVESIAPGVEVYALSAAENAGMESFSKYLQNGKTVAFLGSSGVGKSTIINALLGEQRLAVHEVSETGSRGRHTTTYRELIVLPGGGMVIDTPGMRELQVWGDEEGLKQAFDDIDELALRCRFRDCSHESEPGCAVREAVENGDLDPDRLESFFKLRKEFKYLADRQSMTASAVERARWKDIHKRAKDIIKNREK